MHPLGDLLTVLALLYLASYFIADKLAPLQANVIDATVVFLYVTLGITSIMSLVKWFMTDHLAFWEGFKELVWALIPVLNIFYVWEWWLSIGTFLRPSSGI